MTSPTRILFIGNSYTFFNELPAIVAGLAASAEPPIDVEAARVTKGGVGFDWHCDNSETLAEIDKGVWDVVVLQNHSLGAIEKKQEMLDFGRKLGERAKGAGARVLLFQTWARRNKPEMQRAVTDVYDELARMLDCDVAPVGMAWERALSINSELALHTKDNSHPTEQGSYLAGCVIYATIFGRSPAGLTNSMEIGADRAIDIPEDTARLLQSAAWETVEVSKT